jgi:hypothetical protein
MASSSSAQSWALRMPVGSAQNWTFTFTTSAPGGTTPYSISGSTWEYVARTSLTDAGTPAVKITTTASAAGLITVTSAATLSQVLLQIYPAATSSLTPATYYHSLWINPGLTMAQAIFSGLESPLILEGASQP